MTTTIPKYLELVYDDSHSQNSKCSTGEDVPLTVGLPPASSQQNQVMPTDNGYEIPINEILLRQHSSNSIKGRTFSNSSTVSNVSTLPAVTTLIEAASSSHCQDDCSSLEALLPMASILTVKLPTEDEPSTIDGVDSATSQSTEPNETSINDEQLPIAESSADESRSAM